MGGVIHLSAVAVASAARLGGRRGSERRLQAGCCYVRAVANNCVSTRVNSGIVVYKYDLLRMLPVASSGKNNDTITPEVVVKLVAVA